MVTAAVYPGGAAANAHAMPSATKIRIYEPFGPNGLLQGLRVAATVTGSCWMGSIASSRRPDAWRCSAGHRLYDPCFESPNRSQNFLACVPSPWVRKVIRLRLTAPLPSEYANKGRPPKGLPWAVRTSTRANCVLNTGATAVIAGMRVNYACSNGHWLVGAPNRRARPWTIFQVRGKSTALTQIRLRAAWW